MKKNNCKLLELSRCFLEEGYIIDVSLMGINSIPLGRFHRFIFVVNGIIMFTLLRILNRNNN